MLNKDLLLRGLSNAILGIYDGDCVGAGGNPIADDDLIDLANLARLALGDDLILRIVSYDSDNVVPNYELVSKESDTPCSHFDIAKFNAYAVPR